MRTVKESTDWLNDQRVTLVLTGSVSTSRRWSPKPTRSERNGAACASEHIRPMHAAVDYPGEFTPVGSHMEQDP